MRKILSSLLMAVGLLGFAVPSYAATFVTGEEVSLPKNEVVVDDVYAFGPSPVIASDVQGDLITAGGNVMITGNVTQDVDAAGGTINILGNVGDDLRVAGGNVNIHGIVNGDLLVAGGMVQILPGAVVKGSVYGAGGMVTLDGDVEGGIKLFAGTANLNGSVLGPVDVTADEKVNFGKMAKFAQGVTYASPSVSDEQTGATFAGGVTHKQIESREAAREAMKPDWGRMAAAGFMWFLVRTVAMLLAALLALKLMRRGLEDLTIKTSENFGSRLLWGFAILIAAPIAGIVLLVSVFGSLLGALLFAVYSLLIVVAKIAAGPFVAVMLMKLFKGQKKPALDWVWVLLGVVVYQLLWTIPVIGWFAAALIFLAIFGSVVMEAKEKVKI